MAESPIQIVSQLFYDKDSNVPTDWLLANVGQMIRIETIFEVKNVAISGRTEVFIVNNTDGYLEPGWVTDASYRFTNFKEGDTIYYYNYVDNHPLDGGVFTIVEKRSDGEIRLDPAPTTPIDTEDYQGAISNMTPISAIRYSSNFIENSSADTFESIIDKTDDVLGSEQMYSIAKKLADDLTVSDMVPSGAVASRISNNSPIIDGDNSPVTIQGLAIETSPIYISRFKIVEKTIVTPWILYEQLENQLAGISYKDFESTKCWKFISRIEAAEVFTNPNFFVSETFNKKIGNSGWYNENFNTGRKNYIVLNLSYSNNGNSIDSIQFDESETTIKFDIDNSLGVFTMNPLPIRIGFIRVPSDPADYQNNDFVDFNMLFDGAKVILGDPESLGYNTGNATLSSVKSAKAQFVSDTKITITVVVKMSSDVLERFDLSNTPRYLLFAALKNYALDTTDPLNDQVTLLVDINEFTYVTSDPNMIVVDKNVFLQHPDHDPTTQGVDTAKLYPPYLDARTLMSFRLLNTDTAIIYIERSVTDPKYGEVLGVADWQGSAIATAQKLVDSINDRIAYGTIPAPFTSINTTDVIVANHNIEPSSFTLLLQAPLNSKAKYNGYPVYFKQGAIGGFGNEFYGGSNGTPKSLDVFVEDELVACTDFYIERDTRPNDEIIITSVESKVIATNGTEEFDLESFKVQTGSVSLTGDTQQIDTSILRPFHIPVDEPRKVVTVKRRNDLDLGSRKYFSVQFPFMFRWEDWEKLLNVNPFFLDATKPNNNLNHQWIHYNTGPWKINYQLVINATKNGVKQQYKYNTEFIPHNYESNQSYFLRDIETFDPDTLQPLIFTGKEYIHSGKKTLVVATFETFFKFNNATVVIGMEVYGKGGILGKRSYSSRWVRDGDTWFESLNNDGLVELTLSDLPNSTLIVAKCLINNELLPQDSRSFSLMARCYEYGTIPDTFLVDDTDDENELTDNADNDLTTD